MFGGKCGPIHKSVNLLVLQGQKRKIIFTIPTFQELKMNSDKISK